MTEDLSPLLIRIAEALERLAPSPPEVPDFSLARLFRHDAARARFAPARDYALPLDALLGVDRQKALLCANLERKLVEVDRDEVSALPRLFDLLGGRPERFVVLCDDLSFEDGAEAAKALKSALEGGVSGPPSNVLFLATSNRRHLMPRGHVEDRGLIAAAEDAEEEVSVSDRFGLWIGFPPMDQPTYLAAVRGYARRYGLPVRGLDRRALQWAQARGGRSGRVAWQFILDHAGSKGIALPL